MINHDFYVESVLPQLEIPIADKYPHIQLRPTENYDPLKTHHVFMLVALTGTGKTTTMTNLKAMAGDVMSLAMDIIPSRREIADWITIPTAQAILNEPIQPVRDRVQRFHYTRTFAEHVKGGQAAAFSWVQIDADYRGVILSEGIRGDNEITFALNHCKGWHIVELALHPITRLKRLSGRNEAFDQADGAGTVDFLPFEMQPEVLTLLESGEISTQALTIMRAESESYGLYPFANGDDYTNYSCIDTDNLTPAEVAQEVYQIMKGTRHADN